MQISNKPDWRTNKINKHGWIQLVLQGELAAAKTITRDERGLSGMKNRSKNRK
jgi:phage gpG-like protein